MRTGPRWTLALLMAATVGCIGSPTPLADGRGWGQANRMFESSDEWIGGDSAYSVELSPRRILWQFGDSFVGPGQPGERSGRPMVRNSIAIQQGADPSTATIDFTWGDAQGSPGPFWGNASPQWLWPGPGLRTGDALLLTFMVVEESSGGLGFTTIGGEARRVTNPDEPPADWTFAPVSLPEHPKGARLGAGALLRDGDYVYAFAPVEPGDHDVYLARWPSADFDAGRLSEPQWYGNRWGDAGESEPIVRAAQSEFSVTRVEDKLWMVHTRGFGGAEIVGRVATRPEGPWGVPRPIFEPPDADRDGILIYSAKAHPWVEGAEVAITYCTNHMDFGTMVEDLGLYFPRFVRAEL